MVFEAATIFEEIIFLRSDRSTLRSSLAISNDSVVKLNDEIDVLRKTVSNIVAPDDDSTAIRSHVNALNNDVDALFVFCGNHFAVSESKFRELVYLVQKLVAPTRKQLVRSSAIFQGKGGSWISGNESMANQSARASRCDDLSLALSSSDKPKLSEVTEVERLKGKLENMVPKADLLAALNAADILRTKIQKLENEMHEMHSMITLTQCEILKLSSEVDYVFSCVGNFFASSDSKFKELVWHIHSVLTKRSMSNKASYSAGSNETDLRSRNLLCKGLKTSVDVSCEYASHSISVESSVLKQNFVEVLAEMKRLRTIMPQMVPEGELGKLQNLLAQQDTISKQTINLFIKERELHISAVARLAQEAENLCDTVAEAASFLDVSAAVLQAKMERLQEEVLYRIAVAPESSF